MREMFLSLFSVIMLTGFVMGHTGDDTHHFWMAGQMGYTWMFFGGFITILVVVVLVLLVILLIKQIMEK